MKSVLLNVIFINLIKHSNKHHLQPSIVYSLFLGITSPRLTQEGIKNRLYMSRKGQVKGLSWWSILLLIGTGPLAYIGETGDIHEQL